jgi:hypothetical protein
MTVIKVSGMGSKNLSSYDDTLYMASILINYLVRLTLSFGLQLLKSTFLITVMRLIGSRTFHKWCAVLSV